MSNNKICFDNTGRYYSPMGQFCGRNCCTSCVIRPCIPPQDPHTFYFSKVDRMTGTGLSGGVFGLTAPDGTLMTSTSDDAGRVQFSITPGLMYTLTEIIPPSGYEPLGTSFQIFIDTCGRLLVNGEITDPFTLQNDPAGTGSFTATKVNSLTGEPLEGAQFSLNQGAQVIATTTSSQEGAVFFSNLAPGMYQLIETAALPGYQPSPALAVVVYVDGNVTINGLPADGFQILNVPASTFAFYKYDQLGLGIAGALFSLLSGGILVGSATSDANGLVDFGPIPSGTYQLVETTPPDGFEPNTTVYTVTITPEGEITVDGLPMNMFTVSNTPISFISVLYDANGGIGSYMDTELTYLSPYIIKSAAETGISRPGYVLEDWNTASDGAEVTYTPGETITLTGNLALYGQWVAV